MCCQKLAQCTFQQCIGYGYSLSQLVVLLGGVKQGRGRENNLYFRAKCVNIPKTVGDTAKLLLMPNMKVHTLSIDAKIGDLG